MRHRTSRVQGKRTWIEGEFSLRRAQDRGQYCNCEEPLDRRDAPGGAPSAVYFMPPRDA